MTKIYAAGEPMHTHQELLSQYQRIELGIDGNAAFALLGPDIQEGEAEFVTLPPETGVSGEGSFVVPTGDDAAKLRACKAAMKNLCARIGVDAMPYYFGPSYPYGR